MGAIVVIAASEGGLKPLLQIVAALPAGCKASVFVVMHIGRNPSVLPSILSRAGKLPATFAHSGTLIEHGHIYVAPPDCHMVIKPAFIRLDRGPKAHHTRPAADPLFMSAAQTYGKRVIGIVLSGGGVDGAAGLHAIKQHGGIALVQDLAEAESPDMPREAVRIAYPDACLPSQDIAQCVRSLCSTDQARPFELYH